MKDSNVKTNKTVIMVKSDVRAGMTNNERGGGSWWGNTGYEDKSVPVNPFPAFQPNLPTTY